MSGLRVLLAHIALRICGCALLYWVDPAAWERYYREGWREMQRE